MRGAPPPGGCQLAGKGLGWGEFPCSSCLDRALPRLLRSPRANPAVPKSNPTAAKWALTVGVGTACSPPTPSAESTWAQSRSPGERWAWGRGEAADSPDATGGPVAREERADVESDGDFQVSEEGFRGHRDGFSVLPQKEELFNCH